MYPRYHILIGFLFCLILILLFPDISSLGVSLLFLSSILIDVDHYIYFVFKKKSFSLTAAYLWFKKLRVKWLGTKNKKEIFSYRWPMWFLHNVEVLFLLAIISLYFPFIWFIFFGFLFHLFLDMGEEIYMGLPLYLKFSLIYLLLRNRNKRDLNL